jgi:hypothetical protein
MINLQSIWADPSTCDTNEVSNKEISSLINTQLMSALGKPIEDKLIFVERLCMVPTQ